MKTPAKIVIVLAVALAVVGAVALRRNTTPAETNNETPAAAVAGSPVQGVGPEATPAAPAKLPKLIDLGADKCIPCKAMAPILEGLKKEYAGRMDVQFIDVWKNPDAGKAHGIELIPTQIFFDATGTELFRHVGFYGKEDILGQWKELGVDLGESK